MFYADITIEFKNGSMGAKIIQAHSMEQVMDDAAHYVGERVYEGQKKLAISGDDQYTVVKHRVNGYENA